MEMPGRWKAWKTKSRFSTLPTAPWKSRPRREIPTFPQLRQGARGKVENQNQVSHLPTRTSRLLLRVVYLKKPKKGEFSPQQRSTAKRAAISGSSTIGNRPDFQAHLVLETKSDRKSTRLNSSHVRIS